MWCNTAFGDYPHYLPAPSNSPGGGGSNTQPSVNQNNDYSSYNSKSEVGAGMVPTGRDRAGAFTGWMLLNYKRPIAVSSTLASYSANNANDEDMKTYWSAATSNKGE